MILIIDKRDTILRYEGGCIRVERENRKLQRVPVRQLQHMIIFSNPTAEVSVWRYLAQANVPVAIMPLRGKPHAAMLSSSLATQLPFRRMQHRCANDQACCLAQARYFVSRKLSSYTLSLHTLKRHYRIEDGAYDGFKKQNEQTLEKLHNAGSVSSLMGLEGQLAHAWFVLLAHSLPYHWKFAGRNRRPPRDPVNSILSLGYTLLSSEIHQLIIASVLDPSLGFLHQDAPGRESLMLDFVEIFRSGVDSFMSEWLAMGKVDADNFYYREKQGCRMDKKTRPKFFKAWSQQRYKWPRPIIDNELDTLKEKWPTGEIRTLINWEIMQWRESLGRT